MRRLILLTATLLLLSGGAMADVSFSWSFVGGDYIFASGTLTTNGVLDGGGYYTATSGTGTLYDFNGVPGDNHALTLDTTYSFHSASCIPTPGSLCFGNNSMPSYDNKFKDGPHGLSVSGLLFDAAGFSKGALLSSTTFLSITSKGPYDQGVVYRDAKAATPNNPGSIVTDTGVETVAEPGAVSILLTMLIGVGGLVGVFKNKLA